MAIKPYTCYLSLGSNLGNKIHYLRKAIEDISEICNVSAFSSVYETPAIGIPGAPDFYNICLQATTIHEAEDFMTLLLSVEQKNGRDRTQQGVTSRTIDIDIIFFDDLCINTEHLWVPHPRFQDRKFVLIPLLEIDPELKDPVQMKPLSEYLVETLDETEVKKLEISLFK